MAQSEEVEGRWKAVERLEQDFANLPDKEQAWKDLLELVKDFPPIADIQRIIRKFVAGLDNENNIKQGDTVSAIYSSFPHLPVSQIYGDS